MRLGSECRGVDAADRPGDADRADLRVRRQPAVEIAAAVAEAKAGIGEADAGHQHDIGNDLRTRAAADRHSSRSDGARPSQAR